ncbi:unnamed protein product [Symbiodinium sp. CCMP2456]|nr:unnamed protein product [Symbiodinium sp. CCMP2456]
MQDFLKLMQFFREFQDGQRLHKEQQAVQASGWEHTEVAQPEARYSLPRKVIASSSLIRTYLHMEWEDQQCNLTKKYVFQARFRLRDLFIAASNASHESSLPAELSFEQMFLAFVQFRTMIHDLYPLGDALTAELKYIFAKFTRRIVGEVRSKQSFEDADFPEFLLMMRYLWDTDWPSSPGTSRIGIKAKFQDKADTDKPVKAPPVKAASTVGGHTLFGGPMLRRVLGWSSLFLLLSGCDCTRPHKALHKKGVDEDFKSLKAGLDEYAGLLESAKTAEKSAEDAATEFAVENPKDFAQFKESVQNAAEQSANLLETANTQVLKEDQEIPEKALEDAEAQAKAEDDA